MPAVHKCPITLTLLSISLVGCHTAEPLPDAPINTSVVEHSSEHHIPVQRYGRYTLVELKPDAAKQDLLLQVIDIDLPGNWVISVGDALHYALLRTGYRLCERSSENAALFALPLPAAHLKLGPIGLRDALHLVAGPAWALQTDEQLRQVCFTKATSSIPAPQSVALEALQ